jgi:hypothetical protein
MISEMQVHIPNTPKHVSIGTSGPGRAQYFAAYVLLLIFSSMFLAPLLSAEVVQAGLAACCKRTGKHFCIGPGELNPGNLKSGNLKSTDSFPKGPQVSERCPYAFTHALTGIIPTVGIVVATAAHSDSLKTPPAQTYTYSLPFITPRHADQKRGPPRLSVSLFI